MGIDYASGWSEFASICFLKLFSYLPFNDFQFGILRHASPKDTKQEEKESSLKPTHSSSSSHRVWIDALPPSSGTGHTNVAPALLSNSLQSFHTSQFCIGDRVLGVVKKKNGDTFYLDIGCASPAALNCLTGFEGASKKNRPDIRLKDVIFAAIAQADPDMEIELTCMNEAGKASGMGILGRHEPGSVGNAGGMNLGVMIGCSLQLCRRLSDTANFPLIEKLSKRFAFEICVGCNGRIWLTARSARETMLLANTLALADYVAPEVALQFAEDIF
nr:exosome complex component RRP40 [Hymenolepis microstoma]